MTLERLRARLVGFEPGDTELLTLAQFNRLFAAGRFMEDRKQLAIELADDVGCSVRFIGLDEGYAVFTKNPVKRPLVSDPWLVARGYQAGRVIPAAGSCS